MAIKAKLPSIFLEIPAGETQCSIEIPPEVHWNFSLHRIPAGRGFVRCVLVCVCNVGYVHMLHLLSEECLESHPGSSHESRKSLQVLGRRWRIHSFPFLLMSTASPALMPGPAATMARGGGCLQRASEWGWGERMSKKDRPTPGQHLKSSSAQQITDGNGHSLGLINIFLRLIHSTFFASHSMAQSCAKTSCEWASVAKLECTVGMRDWEPGSGTSGRDRNIQGLLGEICSERPWGNVQPAL